MRKLLMLIMLGVLCYMPGCASTIPLATSEESAKAKQFAAPSSGMSGLYIFRSTIIGQALKKDIWVNGECVGESANNIFFYREVPGNKETTIATESEFSPNELKLNTKSGTNYFIEQYIKMGLFVGGANLQIIDPETAKQIINKLDLAIPGSCDRPTP